MATDPPISSASGGTAKRAPFHVVKLEGVLSAAGLAQSLGAVDLSSDRMLVDVLEMTDYQPEARELFVDWHKRHRSQLSKVAIVTSNAFWRVVVSAMALASGQHMKAFDARRAAEAWLDEA
jgi:hypothetical protein